ncbi:restriction endonuclease [Micromonospora chalcea]|uniref:restriction endonuclease n=1 Tax=Micromonospora chalcea TaxID=1874 RepID=UPI0023785E9F|nr:restriction endonuclease [Micromonospora chalcea]WDQ00010.1 restriction endonuclease [Micromonospora chalcea]
MATTTKSKRIAPQAYEALAEALAVIHWNKQPYETYLRRHLHEHPELLARLDFTQTKRVVAATLVDLLQSATAYDETSLAIMTEIAEMTTFPNLARQTDAAERIAVARSAVRVLADLTSQYRRDLHQRERLRAAREAEAQAAEAKRLHTRAMSSIKVEFLGLHQATDPHRRGRRFEYVLNRLFELHDMEPRLGYAVAHEQIDGSLHFETDDYLVEAKWWKQPVDRAEADVFAAKICRKGRNTLGIFIAVNGFTEGFLQATHQGGTPFITVDGDDLFHILDGRIALPELLRSKRRHLNDTGSCWCPARGLCEGL